MAAKESKKVRRPDELIRCSVITVTPIMTFLSMQCINAFNQECVPCECLVDGGAIEAHTKAPTSFGELVPCDVILHIPPDQFDGGQL
jgi:hypothetical protein